jgi:hypothetical protein
MSDSPTETTNREPFSGRPAQASEDVLKLKRQLILDYKNTFAGDRGKRVWEDLQKRFGYGKWPAADSHDHEVIARRVFMQGPLFYIQTQLDATLSDKPRRKAISP